LTFLLPLSILSSSIIKGAATYIDEYVPTITPISRAKEKPLRDSPPNR